MPTVVLADPDAERRASHRFALETGGLEVLEAESLQQALTQVAEHAPGVVMLAGELCRAIPVARLAAALRAQPETAGVRLVLLVDHGGPVDPAGADRVVVRPATGVDLVTAAVT